MKIEDIKIELKRKPTKQLRDIQSFITLVIESREDNNLNVKRYTCLVCELSKPRFQMKDSEMCKKCFNEQED